MAANTRDIRRRIKSVKNTSQITKAMQMVAAAKMRKAQQIAVAGRAYAELLSKVLKSVSAGAQEGSHELLTTRETIKKELVLVISTDKGLCGALNTNLFREVSRFDVEKTEFVAAGRKASQFLTRTGRKMIAEFNLRDAPSFLETKAVAKFVMEKFTSGEVDKVTVVFTDFINTLTQTPKARTILPITSLEVTAGIGGEQEAAVVKSEDTTEYLFEPNIHEVLSAVLPHHVFFQVYQMVLDARASEHSARMVAMKSATDNAKQLIKDLTLEYNKIRQASITTELLEITTAQMALG